MIGSVDFEAGGKAYTMRMSTNAQVRYQRAAGETLLRGLGEIQDDPSDTERLRRMIWAGLSHVDGLTEDQAGDIMDELGIEKSIQMLSDAVTAAYPKAAKTAEETEGASGNAPRAKASPKK